MEHGNIVDLTEQLLPVVFVSKLRMCRSNLKETQFSPLLEHSLFMGPGIRLFLRQKLFRKLVFLCEYSIVNIEWPMVLT